MFSIGFKSSLQTRHLLERDIATRSKLKFLHHIEFDSIEIEIRNTKETRLY